MEAGICHVQLHSIPVPMNVVVRRLDSNTVLLVSWPPIAIDSSRILSFDVEYHVYKPNFPSTIISTPKNSVEIAGVDGITNYEFRVIKSCCKHQDR